MIDRQIAALGEGGKARLRASQAVDKLFMSAQVELGSIKTLQQREQERAVEKLYVGVLEPGRIPGAPSGEREREIFDQLHKTIMATHDFGRHDAPDGRAARAAKSERSEAKVYNLAMAVMTYLQVHPEHEPQASEKFAGKIRPAILELLGKAKDAPSPSDDEIKRAVGWVKRRGAPPSRRSNS